MRDRSALSWCSLLHAYVASGRMALARELFDEMPAGSISSVAWNTLLTGYSRSGNAEQCLLLFNEMRVSGLSCDDATLCILIDACMELRYPSTGVAVHKIVVQSGWNAIPEVNNSLISFYSKFSLLDHAVKIFESMVSRTVVSWNSLIDAYTRLGHIEQAAALFQSAPETNAISWTSMIGGFARNGCADDALALFVKMLAHEHICPDDFTFGAVLHACATAASLASGRMIHACAFQSGFASYLYVANSLMDMYAKCGDVEGAGNVFQAVLQKDSVSWNTMLFGFAINGWAKEAFAVYERMLSHDVCPNEVTFTGLLTACSHSGLLEQGRTFFESMVSVHGLKPTPEHLACVLDMYARSGNIAKAIEMLDQYSESIHTHSSDMHESLLSAYSSVHLDARIGRKVGCSMVSTEPVRDTGYVMLSNLLCTTGQWKEAEGVRRAMTEHGVKKSPGCSWIHVKGAAKVFVSGGQELYLSDGICDIIQLLDGEMRNSMCSGVLLETDSPGLGKKKLSVLPSSLTQVEGNSFVGAYTYYERCCLVLAQNNSAKSLASWACQNIGSQFVRPRSANTLAQKAFYRCSLVREGVLVMTLTMT
uniref:Pentatricopeptide repeat-containing protein n=1 Tax=Aegilops tauschii TaxID=37682 RepID=M8AH41_AEGTA